MKPGADPLTYIIAKPRIFRHYQFFFLQIIGFHKLFCSKPMRTSDKNTPRFGNTQVEYFIFHRADRLNNIPDIDSSSVNGSTDLLRVAGMDMKHDFRMQFMKFSDFLCNQVK